MKTFTVYITGRPSINNTFEIEGKDLLHAIKLNFDTLIYKADHHHVPYRYPITVSPSYKKEIMGGNGGVELKLKWMYTDNPNKPATQRIHQIWIKANEDDLTDTNEFVILGNRFRPCSV